MGQIYNIQTGERTEYSSVMFYWRHCLVIHQAAQVETGIVPSAVGWVMLDTNVYSPVDMVLPTLSDEDVTRTYPDLIEWHDLRQIALEEQG